jgi:predicted ester cyclase
MRNARDRQPLQVRSAFDHRPVRKTRSPMAGIYCGAFDLTEVHMSDRNKARVAEFLDRVLTGGDIEATGDYFEHGMVEEVPFPGQGPGLDGLKETLIRIRSAFPDSNWTVEEQIAEGDKVLSRFVWSGTHQGEFLGIPATHRPIRVWAW